MSKSCLSKTNYYHNNIWQTLVTFSLSRKLYIYIYIYIHTYTPIHRETQARNAYFTDKIIEIYYQLRTFGENTDFFTSVYISMPCHAVNVRLGLLVFLAPLCASNSRYSPSKKGDFVRRQDLIDDYQNFYTSFNLMQILNTFGSINMCCTAQLLQI